MSLLVSFASYTLRYSFVVQFAFSLDVYFIILLNKMNLANEKTLFGLQEYEKREILWNSVHTSFAVRTDGTVPRSVQRQALFAAMKTVACVRYGLPRSRSCSNGYVPSGAGKGYECERRAPSIVGNFRNIKSKSLLRANSNTSV